MLGPVDAEDDRHPRLAQEDHARCRPRPRPDSALALRVPSRTWRRTSASPRPNGCRTGGIWPRGFRITVNAVEISAGAGFLVAFAGGIATMPGLPRRPNAERVDVAPDGSIT
ncbi:MAG TPA: hypothetical protein DCQ64_28530, partial [Candidatus Rokubacteria bacterium]|nr:hypothetical protein [Candidatus Rokubacteria bacterium]